MYMFLRHEGVQVQTERHYMVAGGRVESKDLVRDAIRVAGPGGGYIAGSSNSIAYYWKPENAWAMARAIQHYGRYPLDERGN